MFAGGENGRGVGVVEGVRRRDVDGCYVGVGAERVNSGVRGG